MSTKSVELVNDERTTNNVVPIVPLKLHPFLSQFIQPWQAWAWERRVRRISSIQPA